MITANALKKGLVFQRDGAPCLVLDMSVHTPSARGAATLVKVRFRNLLTAQVLSDTYKASDRLDEADYVRRKGQFLYASGDKGVFMDLESYEQFDVEIGLFEEVEGYLVDGLEVTLGLYNEQVVSIEPPQVVELLVTETAPALKNATATAQTKEAVLETGISVQVPPYLETGERIKVDTREKRFIGRA